MQKWYNHSLLNPLKIGVIIVSVIAFSKISYGQDYNVVAVGSLGMSPIKLEGKIKKDTSEVRMIFAGQVANYQVIKEVNGITYITDGVKNFELQIYPSTGKVVGKKYDNTINVTSDKGIAVYCVNIE